MLALYVANAMYSTSHTETKRVERLLFSIGIVWLPRGVSFLQVGKQTLRVGLTARAM
jgi:hypothetical protein